jgi:hypothetical protein
MIDHDHDDEAHACEPESVRQLQIEESLAREDAGQARLRKALALIGRDGVGEGIAESTADAAEARAETLFRRQREELKRCCERCPGSDTCPASMVRDHTPPC